MADNPLFSQPEQPGGQHTIVSSGKLDTAPDRNSAISLARQKLRTIYGSEKTMTSELEQATQPVPVESVHQRYMRELSSSGKSLAEIQTSWHNYYLGLSDAQKHEVWQEFYSTNSRTPAQKSQPQTVVATTPLSTASAVAITEAPRIADNRSPQAIRQKILTQIKGRANKPPKSQLRQKIDSILFGLKIGVVAIVVFLFGFFNEYIITPFIQPGRNASATPVILSTDGVAPSQNPEVIIPKIGVQAPVDYTLDTVQEEVFQQALDSATVHYANTVLPGEAGNTAVFGHSSNNIFNKGSYKFIFVRLHKLEAGDTFYLSKDGKMYAYKVFKKQAVTPDETWVLNPVEGKKATATLITCDPPGSVSHRLVVWGEQISPDPINATPPSQDATVQQSAAPVELAGKGPSAWNRFWGWVNPFN